MKKIHLLNKNSFQFFKQETVGAIVNFMDYLLFFAVIISLILDLVCFCQLVVDHMSFFSYGDSVLQMSSNNTGTGLPGNSGIPNSNGGNPGGLPGGPPGGNPEGFGGYNTNRQITHNDDSWSNTIRTIFVYGTGSARWYFNLTRGGTPIQRLMIIGGTLVTDGVGRIIQHAVNDPNYILANATNWRSIINGSQSANVYVDPRTVQSQQSQISGANRGGGAGSNSSSLFENGVSNSTGSGSAGSGEASKSIIGGDIDLGKISETIISKIAEYLDYIFEPVQVSFSNEILSNQIHNMSILLWILTVCLSIFFISLLVNIALFIFSDRLMKYFTNKYILWYLSFNKKVIGFEIVMLSGWIIYLLYILLTGLHYIAIHPIIF